MKALVVGGAACVWNDVRLAQDLFKPDITVVINDIGTVWPHPIDHWVSYHAGVLIHWAEVRQHKGLPAAGQLWSGPAQRESVPGVRYHKQAGGSSGLLATCIAKDLAQKVVLAGIPMDPKMPHWHDYKGKRPWVECLNYQRAWVDVAPSFGDRVRSISGWTADLLGLPTAEWLQSQEG